MGNFLLLAFLVCLLAGNLYKECWLVSRWVTSVARAETGGTVHARLLLACVLGSRGGPFRWPVMVPLVHDCSITFVLMSF